MRMSNFDTLCRALESMDPETYSDTMIDKTLDILSGFDELSEDRGDCIALYCDFLLCSVAADGKLTEEEFLLAKPVLDSVVRSLPTILVKASRGMALEELVEYLLTITKDA